MEVSGKIKLIDVTKSVGASGFEKRDVVVTTDEQYPQHILVQFVQQKCEELDKFAIGDNVTIGINLRGREWVNPQGETVYFNTVQGWSISRLQTAPNTPAQPSRNEYSPPLNNHDEPDDLPF